MTSHETLSEAYIASIKNDNSFFKYIPHDIGELIFCGSSNDRAEDYSKKEKRSKILKRIAICFAIPLMSCLLFNDSPDWNFFLSIVCAVVLFFLIKKACVYKGEDYFVGTNGFCHLKFKGKRDNIIQRTTIIFDRVSDFLTEQIDVKNNGIYTETQYYISFVSMPQKKVVYWERGRYDKNAPDLRRCFYDYVISSWNKHKSKDVGIIPMSFNAFIIKKGSIQESYPSFIVVNEDHIAVNGKQYYYADIKQMKYVVRSDLCLMIEHKNHEVTKKSFWRTSETGDVEYIPLSAMSNQEFFIAYMVWLIRTKHLKVDKD